MIYWTVQKRTVWEHIKKNGGYQPDFGQSDYIEQNKDLGGLYNMILDSFNYHNRTQLPGLIFTFMYGDEEGIFPVPDYNLFHSLMCGKKAVINGLWKNLLQKDCVIMQIEMEQDFNPIFIDINDFQFLMPPIYIMYPYEEADVKRICNEVMEGIITPSVFPSNIIQAHIPYIKKEHVVNVYEMFSLDE